MSRIAPLIAALMVVASVQPGLAASPDTDRARSEAKAALARATTAYRQQRFAEAADNYLEAYEVLVKANLGARPKLLYNAGLAFDRLGACERAAPLYHRFLEASPKEATPEFTRRLRAAERCAPKVALTSEPSGAEVRIDGVLRGRTPMTLHLRAGSYTLSVRKAGYKEGRRAVVVEAAKPQAWSFELESATPEGQLAIDVGFESAVFVDGEKIADGPYRGIRRLAAGQHILRIEQPGCAPRDFTVDVPTGPQPLTVAPKPCVAVSAPPPPPPLVAEPAVQTERASSGVPSSTLWIGGAGLAAAAVGGVMTGLHLSAASRRDRLFDDPTVTASADVRAADNEAYRYSIGAGVSYGLAAVGLATALVIWLAGDEAEPSEPLTFRW